LGWGGLESKGEAKVTENLGAEGLRSKGQVKDGLSNIRSNRLLVV